MPVFRAYTLQGRTRRCMIGVCAAAQARVLAVWDYDWTLVEDNSDTWVVERLGAKPDFLRLQQVGQHVGIADTSGLEHMHGESIPYIWAHSLLLCWSSAAADARSPGYSCNLCTPGGLAPRGVRVCLVVWRRSTVCQQEVVGWTELMDASMAAAASAHGADEAAVRAAARSVPITPEVLQVADA
jgi:Putative Phosphatase